MTNMFVESNACLRQDVQVIAFLREKYFVKSVIEQGKQLATFDQILQACQISAQELESILKEKRRDY